jgi:hypothetical protein
MTGRWLEGGNVEYLVLMYAGPWPFSTAATAEL